MAVCAFSGCKSDGKDGSSGGNDSSGEKADYYNGARVDTGFEWGNVEIVGGGFVPAIVYNPGEEGLVYARTDIGGAYRMNKETGRWQCITDFVGGDDWNYMGIESIAADPVEPNRVYIAAGTYTNQGNGAIFCSDDYGDNWVKAELPTPCGGNEVGRGCGERLMVDPNDNKVLYFASRMGGLFRSEDYGRSWSNVESFPVTGGYVEDGFNIGLTWVAFDKSSSEKGSATKTIFVGAARGESKEVIYRSDDAGESWTPLPENSFEGVNARTFLKPIQGKVSSDGYLYVTFSNNVGPNNVTKGFVQKYSIADNSWTDITPNIANHSGFGYSGLALSETDPQTIVVTTLCLWAKVDNVLVSRDGGATWDGFWDPETDEDQYQLDIEDSKWLDWHGQLKLGWWMTGVAMDPFDPDEIMYGTGATIFGTTNLSKLGSGEKVNITVMCEGLEETAVFDLVSPTDKQEGAPDLYSIMADIYGFRHQDATVAPEEHFGDFASTSIDCGMENYKVVVRTTADSGFGHGIWYSLDAGNTWQDVETLPDGMSKGEGGQAVVSTDGKTIVWVPGKVGSDGYYTNDYGKTWGKCEGLPTGSVLESDVIDPNIFYGISDGQFYVSRDGGKTFTFLTQFLLTNIQVQANPFASGQLYITAGSGGVYFLDIDDGELKGLTSGIEVTALGLGKNEQEGEVPAIFALGSTEADGSGVFLSTDNGATWKRINDDTQKWGNVNPRICGDPKVFGRCYISTNGRGIIMGNKKAD